jgi:Flp pilus assembly protein TadG
MVEFAVVLPIFMLVLSGICDFGFMLYQRMTVIASAREGARAAAMVSDATTIETRATGAANTAAAQGGLTLSDVEVTCSPTPNCSNAVSGDLVSVKAKYTYTMFFPLAFGSPVALDSTVQMVLDSIDTTAP